MNEDPEGTRQPGARASDSSQLFDAPGSKPLATSEAIGRKSGAGSRSHAYQPQLSSSSGSSTSGSPLTHSISTQRVRQVWPLANESSVSATTFGTAPTSPVSSTSSRRAVCSSVSPGSALPPGG